MNIKDSKYAQCLYFTSAALARKVEKLAIQIWDAVDLSPSHAYLLMTILEQPGIKPSVLSAELQLQPSTISRLLDKLEGKKFIVRTSEGKLSNVYPTPKAKELQPKMNQCVQQFSQQYVSLLGAAESSRLVQDMVKIADKLNL
jgi:MarR family transcriptional regulator, organic hydroperoxide resistance regulator